MQLAVIFRSARTVVIELDDMGKYHTDGTYDIFVNDELYMKSDKVVESIYGLLPDTEYTIKTVKENVSAETTIITKKEFVTLNVKNFGAAGDGKHDDTTFIQCAIQACPKNGRVYIPKGKYKISSIFLKSDLRLEFAKGAELSAYTDVDKFPILPGMIESYDENDEYNLGSWEGNPLECYSAIITGINVSNVEITGEGIVDGCAGYDNWWADTKNKKNAWRPRLIFLNKCEKVTIQGITIKNSPSWNLHPYFSQNLKFIDIKVMNPKDSPNTDGLDPESCNNVDIVGAFFSVGDDCIAIKSGKIYMGSKYKQASENLNIRHCCMRDGHGSVTVGSEMAGGIKNVSVTACEFIHTDRGLRIKTRRGRGQDAIIDGILFEDIKMDNVMTPIVINCFYFCDPDGKSEYVQSKEYYPVDERTPLINELTFRKLTCTDCHAAAAYLYGLPEQKIQRVIFDDVSITFADDARAGVPAMMTGLEKTSRLGLFANNVCDLELINVSIKGAVGEKFITNNIDKLIIE